MRRQRQDTERWHKHRQSFSILMTENVLHQSNCPCWTKFSIQDWRALDLGLFSLRAVERVRERQREQVSVCVCVCVLERVLIIPAYK